MTLKDGSTALISTYKVEDFEKVVEMFASLSSEALRWGAPPYTRESIGRWTQNLEKKIILLAHLQDRVVGYCMIHGGSQSRHKGIYDLMIYLHQDFQNKGLGTTMTSIAVKLAKEKGFHRIELEVVADNSKAIHVYEQSGFKIEGIKKDAYYGEDGKYHDMIVMGLLL